jgi:hypothetical protein
MNECLVKPECLWRYGVSWSIPLKCAFKNLVNILTVCISFRFNLSQNFKRKIGYKFSDYSLENRHYNTVLVYDKQFLKYEPDVVSNMADGGHLGFEDAAWVFDNCVPVPGHVVYQHQRWPLHQVMI